ncbi:acetyl-CoA carboxylase biotin carboxyl carrier protein [bacterium]|nr:acetyl-CoA carboxylase biotin carboxyl carrier protein [bacterium]
MKFDLKYLEKLAKLMTESELTEMQLEDQEQSIVLKREKQTVMAQQVLPVAETQIVAQEQPAVAVSEPAVQTAETTPKTGKAIKSPMVGTFYKAASPDAPAFVEVGSLVAQGEVVCIIEAMKLMNEIESDFSGKVVEICVDDGQPVEYGQVLMYIE